MQLDSWYFSLLEGNQIELCVYIVVLCDFL